MECHNVILRIKTFNRTREILTLHLKLIQYRNQIYSPEKKYLNAINLYECLSLT